MSQPETCYLCDEIVTFCQCERSVTDKDEALAILRDRLAEPRQAEATGGELGKALRSLLAYPGLESYVGSVLYGRATNALQSIRWGIDHLLSVGQGDEKQTDDPECPWCKLETRETE